MYDNTARVHDPVMPRMLTCDMYASKFPNYSPFSHCAGNPANALDADGNLVIFANGFYGFAGGGKSYWQCEGFNFANEVMNHFLTLTLFEQVFRTDIDYQRQSDFIQ